MIKHPVSAGDTYYLYATSDGNGSELTCSARGFPEGTYLEVQSISTKKSVTVKVTGRPLKNVIDLSQKAFAEIDSIQSGRIKVKITVTGKTDLAVSEETKPEEVKTEVKAPEAPVKEKNDIFFTVQLAAFVDLESAKAFSTGLKIESYIFVVKDSKELYRVRSGRFPSKEEAEKFKSDNCSNMEAIVVEVTE